MFHYYFLTNNPSIAAFVEKYGANRIFIDLEKNGKAQRQGHLDTVISSHHLEDIPKVKQAMTKAELLVRLNPFHTQSDQEVEAAISGGADMIMLPMIQDLSEVIRLGEMIDGRAKFIPLIETIASASLISEIDSLACVSEIFIGLNDLHLEMGLQFMFELLANGTVDKLRSQVQKPFGFGGIAQVGEGHIPGELVMAEHIRLNSTGVILSRTFHQKSEDLQALQRKVDFPNAMQLLSQKRQDLLTLSKAELDKLHDELSCRVQQIIQSK